MDSSGELRPDPAKEKPPGQPEPAKPSPLGDTSDGHDEKPVRAALPGVLIAAVAAAALYVARPVVVPMVFAVVLAVLIQPVVARLRRRMPHWLSLTLVLLGLAAVMVSTGWLFASGVGAIVAKAPQYGERFNDLAARLTQYAQAHGIDLTGRGANLQEALVRTVTYLGSGLGSVIGMLTDILLVLLLMTFALAEADQFHERLFHALGAARARVALGLVDPLTASIQRYLLAKTVVCIATGLGTYVACLALGVDFAFVWGVLAFLLHYVPYFGPALALLPPVVLALIQYADPTRGLVLLGILSVLFGASGYIAEPRIMGWSLRLSPLFVLFSLMLWGWFWGLAGVVLAVPLSSALVIGFSYIPRLKPLAIFLGATPEKVENAKS